MIHLNDISFGYKDTPVLKKLTVKFEENTAIIGKSGCGKTTLLHLVSGISRQNEGTITIDGVNNREYRNSIGIVMQKGGVFPYKSVYDNIALGLQIKKEKDIDAKVKFIAEKLDIVDKLSKYPKELSGGQVQRVALGRILCLSPKILLLDEPFSALDEITRQRLQDEVLKISAEDKIQVITVTHSIQEAVILGKQVMVMKDSGDIVKTYDTGKYATRGIEYFNKCIEISKEIRSILL